MLDSRERALRRWTRPSPTMQGTAAAAFLFGALCLGRLTHEYISVHGPARKPPPNARGAGSHLQAVITENVGAAGEDPSQPLPSVLDWPVEAPSVAQVIAFASAFFATLMVISSATGSRSQLGVGLGETPGMQAESFAQVVGAPLQGPVVDNSISSDAWKPWAPLAQATSAAQAMKREATGSMVSAVDALGRWTEGYEAHDLPTAVASIGAAAAFASSSSASAAASSRQRSSSRTPIGGPASPGTAPQRGDRQATVVVCGGISAARQRAELREFLLNSPVRSRSRSLSTHR